MTPQEFIAKAEIKLSVTRAFANPNMEGSREMDHFQVKLERYNEHGKRRAFVTTFSQGYGHKGRAPKLESVIACLASDAQSLDLRGFEEWATDLGYDPDSRKAEQTYLTIRKQSSDLYVFFGNDLFADFLTVRDE